MVRLAESAHAMAEPRRYGCYGWSGVVASVRDHNKVKKEKLGKKKPGRKEAWQDSFRPLSKLGEKKPGQKEALAKKSVSTERPRFFNQVEFRWS